MPLNADYNVQLFRDNEFSHRFDDWTKRVKNFQAANFWLMFDTITISKSFGYFIYDNGLSDLAPFFSRDYFAENFTAIIEALGIAGTFEAYLIILRSALGDGVVVDFQVPSESHLIINVGTPTGQNDFVAKPNAFTNDLVNVWPDQVQYPSTRFVFYKSISPITISETLKLIELLNVNGIFVETNFT